MKPSTPAAKQKSNTPFLAVVAVIILAAAGWLTLNTGKQPAIPVPAAALEATQSLPPIAGLGRAWVVSDRLDRHTCPSMSCGVVGKLFFREAADVAEINDGWARITKPYDAACEGGKSAYVDDGNAACSRDNGIVNDQFAEWVDVQYLSPTRPDDPAEGATGYSKLVADSDDFRNYEAVFAKAAQKLIKNGTCTDAEFKNMGGFVKSSNKSGPIYFLYCGGRNLYLNASTGRTFR